MESDQVTSEDNGSVSKTVQQPEIGIHEDNSCKSKAAITDYKESDIDATMELVENIDTANSTIEISKSNDNVTKENEEFENIEANSCMVKEVELQQTESIIQGNISCAMNENVIITDDKNVGATMEPDVDATMEIVDEISADSKILPLETLKNKDNETESNNEDVNTKAEPVSIKGTEKNVELKILDQQNLEKCEENIDEMQADGKTTEKTVTSLSSIALAYDNSDSESEQVESTEKNHESVSNEMEIQITKEYRTVTISDEDSDSSSSSSSDSSSDVESDDSDEAEEDARRTVLKKKNERNNSRSSATYEKESKSEFDDLPPIEDLKISVPEVLCDPLGEVAWMVEQMVVVRPKPGKPTLNLDTILFVERGRRVLGRIFDVFGQVSDPHYCVRFNSTEHIKESDIKVGMIAYFCPNTEYTSVVFVQDLLKMKATDEIGDDEHPEFSDDEEERAYYAALKQKQKSEKAKTTEEIPQKRQRTGKEPGWKSNHPWSGRKQDQSKKTEENYNSPVRPGNTQRNPQNQANLWQQQYPPAYPNVSWPPAPESYQGNTWVPQNPYGYSEPFNNRHQPGNSRPMFRPPHSFQTGRVPYIPNPPFSQQSNRCRFPGMNFPWQSPVPRQPNLSWRFSTPPPPPPPPPPGL